MSEMTEALMNLLMQHSGKSEGFDITDPRDLTRLQEEELAKRMMLKKASVFNPEGMDPMGPDSPDQPRTLGDTWAMESKQKLLEDLLKHAKMQPLPNPQIPLRGAQNLKVR